MSLAHEIAETFSTQSKTIYQYTSYQLTHPSFQNVFYLVFLSYFLCFTAEHVLPKYRDHGVMSRKGFWLDTFYVLFNDIIISVIGFYGICAVTELVFLKFLSAFGIDSPVIFNIKQWNPVAQVLLLFLIQDFMEYWAHFLLHRVDFLWAFHKIHHAQEQLGAASTRRFHFLEMCIYKPLIYIPFALFGYSAADYFLFQITVLNFWGFFTHMNVKINFGPLNYLVNTPQTHMWHHAKNIPKKYGVNYASILTVWDLLFGYYYLPKDQVPKLGVPDQKQVPQTFFAQLAYPFRILLYDKKKAAKNIQAVDKK